MKTLNIKLDCKSTFAGIYRILNIKNGKFYIGSTVNLYNRKRYHWSKLSKNIHPNKHLQAAWNKYGADNFEFSVIEIVEDEILLRIREEQLIKSTNCWDKQIGYNYLQNTNKSIQQINSRRNNDNLSILRHNLGVPKSYSLSAYRQYKKYLKRYGLHFVPKTLRNKYPNMTEKDLALLNLKQIKERFRHLYITNKDITDSIYVIFAQYETLLIAQSNKAQEHIAYTHITRKHRRQYFTQLNDMLKDEEVVKFTRDGKPIKSNYKLTAKGRKQIINKCTGRTLSVETRRKISDKKKGTKLSDEVKKQMSLARRGENNCNCKLTRQQAWDIYEALNAGTFPRQLSNEYNIHIGVIYQIRNGKHWIFRNG